MDFAQYVHKYAQEYQLDPLMVLAIIQVESAGITWATRFEPGWKYFHRTDHFCKITRPPITEQTERAHQQTSWGLMQVMGSVAREHAFVGTLPELCQPELGIKYGCAQLKRVKRNGYSEYDQIAAYNAGSAKKTNLGIYVNQNYVTKVVEQWNRLKGLSLP